MECCCRKTCFTLSNVFEEHNFNSVLAMRTRVCTTRSKYELFIQIRQFDSLKNHSNNHEEQILNVSVKAR